LLVVERKNAEKKSINFTRKRPTIENLSFYGLYQVHGNFSNVSRHRKLRGDKTKEKESDLCLREKAFLR
jgi:hypothetical protein